MQVIINITDEQAKWLQDDLKSFIKNLTDEQKFKIVEEYLSKELSNMFYVSNSYYNKQISNFGEEVLKGLQEKISAAVSVQVLDDPELKKRVEKSTTYIKDNLTNIIQEGLIKYVVERMFTEKNEIMSMIGCTINERLNYRY